MDFHVSLTANIFKGDQIISVDDRNKKIAIQLHMDFKAYNFQYIPVETLSAVYEQFLENDYDNGAIYTSEVLADYLLSEIETAKRLTRTTKILDPACGSGIFLVLAYRRLIEQTLRGRNAQKPTTKQLINLLSNIYGIERELDACYITEFSLILTLLHYIDLEPPELQNLAFHFPTLHNAQIFQADFFDFQGEDSEVNFWQLNLKFDWIIGNPPWLEADQNSTKQKFINAWLANPQNKTDRPVGSRQVAEAFSWVVTDLLSTNGVVGLLLPSTSLFNAESESYRKHFFKQFVILRITNFANLREILFKGRAEKPASVFIYRSKVGKEEKPDILHIAPLITNQLETTKNTEQWSIIIDENDIQTISSREASTGEFLLWKIALRGNYRDKRAIKQIDHLFQTTLAALAIKNNWEIYQGTALRPTEDNKPKDPIKHLPELEGQQQFDADLMKNSLTYFSLPLDILKPITKQNANVRLRSGEAGLLTSPAPHIIVASSGLRYAIYSDRDFIIPTPQIGISGNPEQSELLKALSVFLRSSLTYYYMFFHAPQWGVARRAKYLSSDQIKLLRVPDFTPSQIKELAQFWQNLVSIESERISQFLPKSQNLMLGSENTSKQFSAPQKLSTKVKEFRAKLQIELRAKINEKINQLLEIPDELAIIVEEFVRVRLNADATAQIADTIRSPFPLELENYATRLRDYLDSFVTDGSHFQLKITAGPQLIECYLQMTRQQSPIPVQIETSSLESTSALDELSIALRQQINQWAYVQRGLRLFNEPDIYIYKAPRLVNWTQTQAMNDAADIIAQVLTTI